MPRQRFAIMLTVLLAAFAATAACSCGDDDDDDGNGVASPNPDDDIDDDAIDDDADDDAFEPRFFAGAARVDTSPPSDWPLMMGGYGLNFISQSFARWSTGVHDPIYATALALQNTGEEPVILIHLDLVGMITTDIVRVQAGVADALDILPERIVLASSHTHHSPDSVGIWGVLLPPVSGRDEAYMDLIVERAIEAGIAAYDSLRPARLFVATGSEPAMHYNSNEVPILNPSTLIDDAMTFLVARDADGAPIATLMNWGCHPMVMGPQNTEISSDFLGPYYRLMDEEIGGVNMFVNGPLGASIHPINPYDPFDYTGRDWGTWEDVENFGRVLADDAQALAAGAVPVRDTAIDLFSGVFESRNDNLFFALAGALELIPRDIPNWGDVGETTLTTFTLGPDIRFATAPGELVPDLGLAMRAIIGGRHQFIINLGMDWVGYIMTPQQYRNVVYIYNDLLSPGPNAGVDLIAAYEQIYGVDE
ncbi:MAG: neutral/alkaline non-lysosomal ceramidase N-terminal domain-containing protein [Deltaproteobacteria bacterium]|nr:neutral/alkaline non-lysosomal ceramidase N-terminal domain-containing protein [Deltaproteobacteria bacterium]